MKDIQLSKEILVLSIKLRRNHLANLEGLLNAFRNIKYIQFNRNRVSKTNDPEPMLIQQKIDQTISQINLNTEILSELKSELVSFIGDSNIYKA